MAKQTIEYEQVIERGCGLDVHRDTVVATATVTKVDLDKRRVFFRTTCKVKNKIVIDGKAELYVPKDK